MNDNPNPFHNRGEAPAGVTKTSWNQGLKKALMAQYKHLVAQHNRQEESQRRPIKEIAYPSLAKILTTWANLKCEILRDFWKTLSGKEHDFISSEKYEALMEFWEKCEAHKERRRSKDRKRPTSTTTVKAENGANADQSVFSDPSLSSTARNRAVGDVVVQALARGENVPKNLVDAAGQT